MAKKVAFVFDPFKETGVEVPRANMKEARETVADFVKQAVLEDMAQSKSPVAGGRWKRPLSKSYAKKVGKFSSDLHLSGKLTNALDVKTKKRSNKLSLEVAGKEAGKADGNNRGTYGQSQRTNLGKAREFIPRGRKTLTKGIWKGVEKILKTFKD